MTNALVHKIEVTDRATVQTVEELYAAVHDLCDNQRDYLDVPYVVSRWEETLSDGSVAVSICIRPAERV